MPVESHNEPFHPRRLLSVLRRRFWILILCAVVGAGVAYLLSHSQTKKYSSTASLLFQQNDLSQQLFGFPTSTAVDPTTQTATDLNLVSQPVVAIGTAKGLGVSPSAVSGAIDVSSAGATDVVNVTATSTSPAFAAKIANAYAQHFVTYRQQAERAQVLQSVHQLQSQVNHLRVISPGSRSVANLQTRLAQLEVVAAIQTGDVQVANPALIPAGPSSPRTKRATLVGLVGGLLVGLLLMLLAERIDQTLRDPDEVQRLVGLPLLGTIPFTRALARTSRADAFGTAAEAETFRLLRAQLRYFNVDRAVKSVLVSSASPGDGKSTVAWNLARAAASMTSDTSVLLVDADLRRPRIAELAGLAQPRGLTELLTHDLDLQDVVTELDIGEPQNDRAAHLSVLFAGGIAPNPAELMDSNKLRELVSELHARYDFVVFDAPPPSIVSDAIPLMAQVDGVLLVVRLRHTRRFAVTRLREQIHELRAHPLGLVLNDVRATRAGYGGYGEYAAYAAGGALTSSEQPRAAVDGDR